MSVDKKRESAKVLVGRLFELMDFLMDFVIFEILFHRSEISETY